MHISVSNGILQLGNYIISTLRGIIAELLDPPLPLPELIHEEVDGYENSLFQEHIFNQVLRLDYQNEMEAMNDSNLAEFIEKLKSFVPNCISEVFDNSF